MKQYRILFFTSLVTMSSIVSLYAETIDAKQDPAELVRSLSTSMSVNAGLFLLLILLFIGWIVQLYFNHWKTRLLLQGARRAAAVLNVMPGRIAVVDVEGKYLFLHDRNLRFRAKIQWPLEMRNCQDVTGKTTMLEVNRGVIATMRSAEFEFTFEEEYFRSEVSYLPENVYGCPAAIWVTVNITKQAVLQKEISDYAGWLQFAMNSVGDAIVTTDEAGYLVYMNQAACRLAGTRLEEVLGKKLEKVFEMMVEGGELFLNTTLQTRLVDGETVDGHDLLLINHNGEELRLDCKLAPLFDDGKKLKGFVGILHDVSQEYRLQSKLKEDYNMLQQAASIADICYFHCDEDGKFLGVMYANDSFWPMANGAPVEPDGWMFEEDIPSFKANWMSLIRRQLSAISVDYRVRNGASFKHYNMKVSEKRDPGGKFVGFYGTVQDVTDRNLLLRERLDMIRQLENHVEHERIINGCLGNIISRFDLSGAEDELLWIIGSTLKADRSYIFRLEEGNICSNVNEWVSLDVFPVGEELQHVAAPESWMTAFRQHRLIVLGDVASIPPEYADSQQELMRQEVKSLIVAEIVVGNHLWGFVGLDFVKAKREFSKLDEHIIREISHLIVCVIERRKYLELTYEAKK